MLKVQLDQQDLKAHKDQQAALVLLVLREHREQQVVLVQQDLKVPKEQQELPHQYL